MGRSRWVLVAAGFAALVIPPPVAAQMEGPPAFSVAVGAGIAFPFHSDFSSNPFAWQIGARVRASRHVLVEGVYEQWRDTTTLVTGNITMRNAAGMTIGHAAEIRTEDTATVTNAGINVLATGAMGRARVSGGGGPGLINYSDDYEVALTSCVADVPQLCAGTVRRDARTALAVQAAVELDVTIAPWLSAFARTGIAVPVEDPGAGFASATTGVRFSLRR